jgi:hypothetical protein
VDVAASALALRNRRGHMCDATMLRVHFEASCSSVLQEILLSSLPRYFEVDDDPGTAHAIIFETDEWRYIRRNKLYRSHPLKSICISQTDRPSFVLPSIYSSNRRGWIAAGRSETTSYFMTQHAGWNPWVTALAASPRPKAFLYSFLGRSSSRVRKRLFRTYRTEADGPTGGILIEPTSGSGAGGVTYDQDAKKRYAEVMAASKFALCPRGWGTGSVRLFEALEMGICPVILSDGWIPIRGIDWSFAIFVAEGDIPDLDRIIRAHENEWAPRGAAARRSFLHDLAREHVARNLYVQVRGLLSRISKKNEQFIRMMYPIFHIQSRARERARKLFLSNKP